MNFKFFDCVGINADLLVCSQWSHPSLFSHYLQEDYSHPINLLSYLPLECRMMGTSFRPIQGGRICQCPPTALSKLDKLIRFGPLYCIGEDMKFKKLKEDAWQHVINNSGQISEKTIDTYQSTIKSFEPTIQDMYIFHDGGRLSSDEPEVNKNLECLVMDGCFFLIVVLNLLGATANGLHYLPGQFIWGSYLSQIETQSLKKLFLKSIIFPGNQLPFLVLDELLQQTFFREIITQKSEMVLAGRWLVASSTLWFGCFDASTEYRLLWYMVMPFWSVWFI